MGYFFEEARLRSLVDERQIRERTFWVNKETGLSGAWDLQIGRMQYASGAYSPRHVHHASKTSPVPMMKVRTIRLWFASASIIPPSVFIAPSTSTR